MYFSLQSVISIGMCKVANYYLKLCHIALNNLAAKSFLYLPSWTKQISDFFIVNLNIGYFNFVCNVFILILERNFKKSECKSYV